MPTLAACGRDVMVRPPSPDFPLTSFAFKLCADDFGLTLGVSAGILEAMGRGRVSATSAMTNMPDWPRAAQDFTGSGVAGELGLHFNLTQGRPLTPMPSFAPKGEFPSLNAVMIGAILGRLPEQEIRAELRAQLDAFEQAAGLAPDFIDGHQHVHGFPGVCDWLADELAARPLPPRFWVRDSSDLMRRILARRVEWTKAVIVARITAGLRRAARLAGLPLNEGFAGFSAFSQKRDYATDFASFLAAPGQRHLVMCHPGHADEALRKMESWSACRANELAFLLSDRFPAVLAQAGARLETADPRQTQPRG